MHSALSPPVKEVKLAAWASRIRHLVGCTSENLGREAEPPPPGAADRTGANGAGEQVPENWAQLGTRVPTFPGQVYSEISVQGAGSGPAWGVRSLRLGHLDMLRCQCPPRRGSSPSLLVGYLSSSPMCPGLGSSCVQKENMYPACTGKPPSGRVWDLG